MSNIRFASPEHRDFFLNMMNEARRNDCYHRAFFYVMGIAPETRANIRQMFDFKQDCIDPEGMHGGWQTSGTVRVCRLAFNFWNGYTDPEYSNAYSPEDLKSTRMCTPRTATWWAGFPFPAPGLIIRSCRPRIPPISI